MRRPIALLCLSLVAGPAGLPAEMPSPVRVGDGLVGAGVRRALQRARRRLADPECRRVLGDFTDLRGRPLQAILDDLGQAPEDYLDTVLFYDGSDLSHCANRATLAVTSPGSHVVYVCAPQIVKLRGGPQVEAMVIHEMLHSLGLGEDPPSGREITTHVKMRCGL